MQEISMHCAVAIACICPGGCQLALHGDVLYLYSGHTVTVDKEDRSESDTVHDDLWSLDLNTFVVRSTCPVSHPTHFTASCDFALEIQGPRGLSWSSLNAYQMRRVYSSLKQEPSTCELGVYLILGSGLSVSPSVMEQSLPAVGALEKDRHGAHKACQLRHGDSP